MSSYDTQVCVILRYFESDSEYLNVDDFWIQKLKEEDRSSLSKELRCFNNYPFDQHLAGQWLHIGRGGLAGFLDRWVRIFLSDLFHSLKLFQDGDLLTPSCFARVNEKWYEQELHGTEKYSFGFKSKIYVFNEKDVEPFQIFRAELKEHLKFMEFSAEPYLKKPDILKDIDFRCLFAVHMLLKNCIENFMRFFKYDKLIDYTNALESLYLEKGDSKKKSLSSRIPFLIGKTEAERREIELNIKKFYEIRSKIVHGWLIDTEESKFLDSKIHEYESYLRKSILAFLDLNKKHTSKKKVLKILDQAQSDGACLEEIHGSLRLLNLAR